MLPFIVTGETTEKQQCIFLTFFSHRSKLLKKLKLFDPVLLFPLEISTDNPKIARNAYNDVCYAFYPNFEKFWRRTLFSYDILHSLKNFTSVIPPNHPDGFLMKQDLIFIYRRIKFPSTTLKYILNIFTNK